MNIIVNKKHSVYSVLVTKIYYLLLMIKDTRQMIKLQIMIMECVNLYKVFINE